VQEIYGLIDSEKSGLSDALIQTIESRAKTEKGRKISVKDIEEIHIISDEKIKNTTGVNACIAKIENGGIAIVRFNNKGKIDSLEEV